MSRIITAEDSTSLGLFCLSDYDTDVMKQKCDEYSF